MTARPERNPQDQATPDVAALERRLFSAVSRARAALFWERFWPAFAWPLAVIAAFLVVSWAGLWLDRSPAWKGIGLGLFALVFLASLWPMLRLRWPKETEAMRRIETMTGLDHRPISSLADRLDDTVSDPGTRALWLAHRRRIVARLDRLKAGAPSPRLDKRDPYALRAALGLVLVVAFVYAGPDRARRILAAFDTSETSVTQETRFDAWVTPPAYTGRAPIFLTRLAPDAPERPVAVPQGSEFVARVDGAETVSAELVGEDGTAIPVGQGDRREGTVLSEFKHRLEVPGRLRVMADGRETAAWTFEVDPDDAPRITLAQEPERALSGALKLNYSVEDDYGVVQAEARFEPVAEDAEEAAEPTSEPRPLYGPPNFRLSLPQRQAREGAGETFKDLTEHPWAGAETEMRLAARDEADQWGFSEPKRFALPSRRFTKPLARAVIEQRRNLALDANASELVAQVLDVLTIDPEKRIEGAGIYLGLRSAHSRLVNARDDDALRSVVDQLWEVALAIEDGDLSLAERALREAQEALRQALEDGASDEEIERLMQELRQALAQFMQQMMAEAQRNPGQMPQMPPNAQNVQPQDLDRMLKQIEELAKSGSRDAAREMLAQLQNMLENMQAARQQQGQGQSQMSEAMNELGEMIREQQRLMNETFRQGRQGQQQPGQRGQRGQQGQQGQQGQGEMSPEEMAEALRQLQEGQSALQQRLQEMMEAMRQNGMQEGPLGEAGEAMGDAAESLGQGAPGEAVDSQSQALDGLRRGAQSMAEQMQPGPGEGQGPGGERGYADEDPLGRPRRTEGPDFGTSVRVPDEIDVQRARQILDELRRRLSDPARPRIELDYLERLLERF